VLLDSTHKTSAFSNTPPQLQPKIVNTEPSLEHVDRHPCLASSFWPQMSSSTMVSHKSSPKNPCLSPAWSNPLPRAATTFGSPSDAAFISSEWSGADSYTPPESDSVNT
jgi:hypothetical protein